MSKRFFDIDIWKDPWYRELSPKHKSLWFYLFSNCDNAGIWKEDFELASFQINAKLTATDIEALNIGKKRVIHVGPGNWLVVDYIAFQIGKINGEHLTNLQKNCKDKIGQYLDKGIDIVSLIKTTPSLPVPMDNPSGIGIGNGIGIGKGNVTVPENEKIDPMDIPFEFDEGNPYTLITPNQFNKLIDKVRLHNIPDYGLKSMLDYYSNWIQEKVLDHPNSQEYKNRSAYHNIIKWVIAWWLKDGVKMAVPEKWKTAKFTKIVLEDFNAEHEKQIDK